MNVLEKKAEEQCELRERVEKELRQSRQQGSTLSALESREAQTAKHSVERYGCVAVCSAVLLPSRWLFVGPRSDLD